MVLLIKTSWETNKNLKVFLIYDPEKYTKYIPGSEEAPNSKNFQQISWDPKVQIQ